MEDHMDTDEYDVDLDLTSRNTADFSDYLEDNFKDAGGKFDAESMQDFVNYVNSCKDNDIKDQILDLLGEVCDMFDLDVNFDQVTEADSQSYDNPKAHSFHKELPSTMSTIYYVEVGETLEPRPMSTWWLNRNLVKVDADKAGIGSSAQFRNIQDAAKLAEKAIIKYPRLFIKICKEGAHSGKAFLGKDNSQRQYKSAGTLVVVYMPIDSNGIGGYWDIKDPTMEKQLSWLNQDFDGNNLSEADDDEKEDATKKDTAEKTAKTEKKPSDDNENSKDDSKKKKNDDAEPDDSEDSEDSEDAEPEDDSADPAKNAALKDSYTKAFKNTLLKLKIETSVNELSLDDKIKFFTELSKAWKHDEEVGSFMSDKAQAALNKIVVTKK
jgi:hypothetical protein